MTLNLAKLVFYLLLWSQNQWNFLFHAVPILAEHHYVIAKVRRVLNLLAGHCRDIYTILSSQLICDKVVVNDPAKPQMHCHVIL